MSALLNAIGIVVLALVAIFIAYGSGYASGYRNALADVAEFVRDDLAGEEGCGCALCDDDHDDEPRPIPRKFDVEPEPNEPGPEFVLVTPQKYLH